VTACQAWLSVLALADFCGSVDQVVLLFGVAPPNCICLAGGFVGGSHVDQDDLSAGDLGQLVRPHTSISQTVILGDSRCDNSKELAGTDGDIDLEDDAVYTTHQRSLSHSSSSCDARKEL